mgnify:CR=1 FL=1
MANSIIHKDPIAAKDLPTGTTHIPYTKDPKDIIKEHQKNTWVNTLRDPLTRRQHRDRLMEVDGLLKVKFSNKTAWYWVSSMGCYTYM